MSLNNIPKAFRLNLSLCLEISVQISNNIYINPGKLGDWSPDFALFVKDEQQALLSHRLFSNRL